MEQVRYRSSMWGEQDVGNVNEGPRRSAVDDVSAFRRVAIR